MTARSKRQQIRSDKKPELLHTPPANEILFYFTYLLFLIVFEPGVTKKTRNLASSPDSVLGSLCPCDPGQPSNLQFLFHGSSHVGFWSAPFSLSRSPSQWWFQKVIGHLDGIRCLQPLTKCKKNKKTYLKRQIIPFFLLILYS